MAFQDDLDKLKNFSDGLPTGPLKDLAANGVGFAEKLGPVVKKIEDREIQGIGLGNNLTDVIEKTKEQFANSEDAGLEGGAIREEDGTAILEAINEKATDTSVHNAKSKPLRIKVTNGFYERKNVMHSLASYTYNFELYILTYEDYNQFVNDPTFNIENSPQRLLIKSGGGNYANRNPFFQTDFFMDDLEIDSIISPGGSNKGSINTGLSFKISEPYGMTLLNSLVLAANHFGAYNYIEQPYLLKVMLTGYDAEGRHVGNAFAGKRTRYIPIRFTDFKFGTSEQGTTYDITAIPYHSIGLQSIASTIPVDMQIEAKTVHDFFNVALTIDTGKEERVPAGPPSQTIMVPIKQLEKGLTGYLNKLEDDHVKSKLKAVPDIYNFEIDPDILKSKIVLQDVMDLSKTANTKDVAKQAQQRFTDSFVFDETTKTYSIRAGTSIVNTIHSILRSCEYMTNQVVSADLKIEDMSFEEYQEVANKPIDFYRIVPKITLGPFDKIRNQYAKLITFVIKKYQMHGKDYENLGQKPVEYISKYYDYFYTGNNTDILSFDIEFNAAYFQTYTYNQMQKAGSFPTPLAQTKLQALHEGQTAKAGNDPITKWTPYIRHVVTQSGTSNDINDPQVSHKATTIDNFMQNVFDQGADLLQMNMRIVGDPSFIQSKDLRSVLVGDSDDYYLPDGSLNTDKEWHIYVKFRNPTDVDASTGLMKGFNVDETGKTSVSVPSINGQYKVYKVTSNFSGGTFTQNLECVRERKQELNVIKKKDDNTSSNRVDNLESNNTNSTGTTGKVDTKGNKITEAQRNALSNMNMSADDFEYTPDKYLSSDARGQLENGNVDEFSNVGPQGIGTESLTSRVKKITPEIIKPGTADNFQGEHPFGIQGGDITQEELDLGWTQEDLSD